MSFFPSPEFDCRLLLVFSLGVGRRWMELGRIGIETGGWGEGSMGVSFGMQVETKLTERDDGDQPSRDGEANCQIDCSGLTDCV